MKKLFLIILGVGALVLSGYLSVRFFLQAEGGTQAVAKTSVRSSLDLRPLLIDKLKQMVKDGSDGLYNLSLGDLQADILQSKLVLINARLVPDSVVLSRMEGTRKAPDDVVSLRFPSLHIDGIGIKDVLSKKHLNLDTIRLQSPVIDVYHLKRPYNKKQDSATLYQRLATHLEGFSVKKVIVTKGTVVHHNLSKRKKATFNEVELVFSDIRVDSATQHDAGRFLFAKDALLSFKNYSMRTPDGLYAVALGSVRIAAAQRQMTVLQAALTPRYGKQQFQKKVHFMKERYRVHVPKVVLRNINWWSLMNEEGLEAGSAEITNAKVELYLDRSQPRSNESKVGNYPHQMLMKLPLPVRIPRLHAKNMEIRYEEFNPASGKSGTIIFDKIDARVSNITNIPAQIRRNKQAVLTATARFMHRVRVKTTLRFDLANHKQGNFSAILHLGGFDASGMNAMFEPLGMLSVKSGNVKETTASIKGNNYSASGTVLLLYNDLNIAALEKSAGRPGKLNKRRLFSFVANNFVIKKSNPSDKEAPRSAECFFERDARGSFFNLIWKTMLTGLLKTVGASPKLAEK